MAEHLNTLRAIVPSVVVMRRPPSPSRSPTGHESHSLIRRSTCGVADLPSHALHELAMRDRIEVFGQIGVDDVRVAPADQPVRQLDGVERASLGPVSVGAVFQVRLEDRPRVKPGGWRRSGRPDPGWWECPEASPRRPPVWGSSPDAPAGAGRSSRRHPRAKPPATLPGPPPRSSRTRSLSCPRQPLSRGFDPASHPAKPLVSYRTHRH